jgi:hypothetical protein
LNFPVIVRKAEYSFFIVGKAAKDLLKNECHKYFQNKMDFTFGSIFRKAASFIPEDTKKY